MDKLDEIFKLQGLLQRRLAAERGTMVPAGPACDQQPLCQACYTRLQRGIQKNALAMMMEASELMDWTKWKDWSDQLGNKQAIGLGSEEHLREMQLEVVDLLHFLVNAAMWLGLDADQLHELYLHKNQVNHERQEQGY